MNKNKMIKSLKTVVAGFILIAMSLVLSKTVEAYTGSTSAGMADATISDSRTGYFWQTASDGIIFCNDQDSMIRFGYTDSNRYYPTAGEYGASMGYMTSGRVAIYSDRGSAESFLKAWLQDSRYEDHICQESDKSNVVGGSFSVSYSGMEEYRNDGVDYSKPYIIKIGSNTIETNAVHRSLRNALIKRQDALAKEVQPPALSGSGRHIYNSINREYSYYDGSDPINGPQVAVPTNSSGARGYSATFRSGTIDTRTSSSFEEIVNAYIYSAQYHVSRENPSQYSLVDIQVASWLQNDHKGSAHGFNADGTGSQTLKQGVNNTRGLELYKEATQYYKFAQEIRAGYKATVNVDDAQIFVSRDDGNRSNDEYIIGPVSITYPYYKNISYMTDIILNTTNKDGGSATLSYKAGEFKIIAQSQGDTKLTGGTIFPVKNESFYIVLNAADAAYPDNIEINGQFEYTDYATTSYTTLDAKTRIYTYKGYQKFALVTMRATENWKYSYYEQTGTHFVDYGYRDDEGVWHPDVKEEPTYEKREGSSSEVHTIYASIFQVYVQMDLNNYSTDDSQQLRGVIGLTPSANPDVPSGTTHAHKTTAEASNEIDLTMKIGGYTFVDVKAGKESDPSGNRGTDGTKAMSNVTVKLHQRKPNGDESVKAETKTDGNGYYEFKDLNSLYTYYVEFVYNGQYYEPTVYKRDGVSWENSSKGVDPLSDRQAFNMKFKEIGSTPTNGQRYSQDNIYAPVYTRDDLYSGGYIDEFGNLTSKGNGGDSQSTFAKDCMLSSYTGYNQGGFKKDYYPVYQKFVVDDVVTPIHKVMKVTDTSGRDITTYNALYAGEYNNLYVNQGYILRESADLSLYKDVLKTTVEMNGKTQTYKYDKNDPDNVIELKASDVMAYYSRSYSRELYKEDYFKPLDNTETALDNDELLKVYVTYKIRLRNSAQVIAASGVEIVDYYDNEYQLIGSDDTLQPSEEQYRPYVADRKGNTIDSSIKVKTSNTSKYARYNGSTQKNITGYNTTYITVETTDGKDERILQPSGDLYIYVTFKVKDIGNLLILDDGNGTNDNGKVNIVEINGYRTYYGDKSIAPNANNSKTDTEYNPGDVAGLVDVDSIAGNINTDAIGRLGKNTTFEDEMNKDSGLQNTLNSISQSDPDYAVKVNEAKTKWLREKFGMEDDSDKAPQIKIKLSSDEEARSVSGMVWEDKRTETVNNVARVGNGKIDEDSGISGVRVQLVDIRQSAKKGQEIIAKTLRTNGTSSWTWNENSNQASLNNAPTWETADTTTSAGGDKGSYSFVGYIPSNYVVKFIYGIDGMEKDANGGIIYNGQDYKSTEYYTPISDSNGNVAFDISNPDNNAYTYVGTMNYPVNPGRTYNIYNAKGNDPSTTYFFNLAQSDSDNKAGNRYSDARDIMGPNTEGQLVAGTREYVNNYSNNAGNGVTNSRAKELFDKSSTDFTSNTFMVAQSGQINVEIEYNRTESETGDITGNGSQDSQTSDNYSKAGYYKIQNLDLGLVERSKAQLKVTKQVTNVKVTLANGNTLFDASGRATNVLWSKHVAHEQDTENTYTERNNYQNQLMKEPSARSNANSKGLIQLTMDEELMQGANIRITYAITVANIGEVDYEGNEFYYTGFFTDDVNYYTGKNGATGVQTIVTTTPDNLIDYVGFKTDENTGGTTTVTRNNLQFNAEDNPDWEVIPLEGENSITSKDYLDGTAKEKAKLYKTIVVTKDTASTKKELIPIIADQDSATKIKDAFDNDPLNALTTVNGTSSVSGVQLVLTQPLSPDNTKGDDMSYSNLVELVRTSNKLGRRMAYSVVGNQKPTEEPAEIDADTAQDVTILPPFGQHYIYYVLSGLVAGILIIGIVTTIVIIKKRK